MTTLTLDKLEQTLAEHVKSNSRDGIREVVIELCAVLEIPPKGDPSRVVRDQATSELINRCAELLVNAVQPEPLDLCAHIVLCAIADLVTSENTAKIYRFARVALRLANASQHPQTIRRALNHYSAASTLHGDATAGFDYAARSYALAVRLKDDAGVSAALQNAGAALLNLNLHKECTRLAKERFSDASLCGAEPHLAAGALLNTATSYLTLRDHHAATAAVSRARLVVDDASLSTKTGLWNAVHAEFVALRCAIELGDGPTVSARMHRIDVITRDRRSGRVDILCEQAAAVYDCYQGKHADAIARLTALRIRTKSLPGLHIDTLSLLQAAYQAVGDHAGALSCLAEAVKHRSHSQIARIANVLRDLGTDMQTVSPAHEVAADVIERTRKGPNALATPDARRTNTSAMQDTFERLAVAAELNEDDSGRHSYRVGRLAGLLAAEIGHDADTCGNIERAARLHDIGKLGLPGALLARPEALSAAEKKVMREHTEIGRKILEQAHDPAFDLAKDIAYAHRERWDGKGYPQKLKLAAIPEAARMTAIAEAFDVLTQGRAYQAAVSVPDALKRIEQASGTQFEPRLVTAFAIVVNRAYRENDCDDGLLSEYLGSAGTASSFLQARDSMHTLMGSL